MRELDAITLTSSIIELSPFSMIQYLSPFLLVLATLLFVFLLSCFITRFNFQVVENVKEYAIYSSFKYQNFFCYGFIICICQYFLSLLYSLLGFACCKRNKNLFVTVLFGYLSSLAFILAVYLILYVGIINRCLGFKNLTDYFLLTDYWYFDDTIHLGFPVFLAMLFCLIILGIVLKYYQSKERPFMENEKQVA